MQKVELIPAYSWCCENCGRENFVKGIVSEMSEESMIEMKEEFGIEPWEQGSFMLVPSTVLCPYCNEVFETIHYEEKE